jgi:TolA-binding protein
MNLPSLRRNYGAMNYGTMFSLLCFASTLFFGLGLSPVGARSATDSVQKDGNEAGENWSELLVIDAADAAQESAGGDDAYDIGIEAEEAVRAGNGASLEAGGGPALKEISVLKGEDFTIRLREAGWYLTRYESKTIGYRRRVLGEGYTDFQFIARESGTGFLFLRHGRKDVYLLVHIGEERGTPAGDGGGTPASTVGAETGGAEGAAQKKDVPTVPIPGEPDGSGSSSQTALAADTPVPEPPEPMQAASEPSVVAPDPVTAQIPDRLFVIEEPAVSALAAGEAARVEGLAAGDAPRGRPAQNSPGTGSSEPASGLKKEKSGAGASPRSDANRESKEGLYYIDRGNRVVEVSGANENDAYRKGTQYFQKGDSAKSLASYREYLAECEKCTHSDEVNLRIAEMLIKEGKEKEAGGALETLTRSGSQEYRAKAYLLRADIDYRSGNLKRALEGYASALSAGAGTRELERKVGDLYYEEKDYDSALAFYERCIKSGSADDEVYYRAALICDSLASVRDIEKAYRYYRQIVEKYRTSVHAEHAQSRIRFFEKNFFHYK